MHRMRTLEDFGGHSGSAELEYVWLPAAGGASTRIAWVGERLDAAGPQRAARRAGPRARLRVGRIRRTAVDALRRHRHQADREGHGARAPGAAARGPPPTPDEVMLSPDGKRALVRANRNVYMITVPPIGGAVPTVSAAASSSVPTWRLTKVGGDFIGWTNDSKAAYFSIGRSFFLHDIALQAEVDAANRANAETEAERAAAPTPPRRPDAGQAGTQKPAGRRRRSRRSSTSRTASTSRSSWTRTSRRARSRCATRASSR